MATVTLSKKQPGVTKKIEERNVFNVSFSTGKRISTVEEILPFRIRFTAIQIPTTGPGVVPPIPLQIIGYSNYIL